MERIHKVTLHSQGVDLNDASVWETSTRPRVHSQAIQDTFLQTLQSPVSRPSRSASQNFASIEQQSSRIQDACTTADGMYLKANNNSASHTSAPYKAKSNFLQQTRTAVFDQQASQQRHAVSPRCELKTKR
jgi:hypothetical protein